MITAEERQGALRLLTRTRQSLLDAVAGLSDEQARWKPGPDRWSILEYVEHLAVSDGELVALIKRTLAMPATPETPEARAAREAAIRQTPIPRGANQAPERLKPKARFESLDEAVRAFLAAREQTIAFAETTQDDLRSHFAPHTVLGPLDGYQWLLGNARHVDSHIAHMNEIREMAAFPGRA